MHMHTLRQAHARALTSGVQLCACSSFPACCISQCCQLLAGNLLCMPCMQRAFVQQFLVLGLEGLSLHMTVGCKSLGCSPSWWSKGLLGLPDLK